MTLIINVNNINYNNNEMIYLKLNHINLLK